jgi:hypothetical protein
MHPVAAVFMGLLLLAIGGQVLASGAGALGMPKPLVSLLEGLALR